jgi:hypothetical protein
MLDKTYRPKTLDKLYDNLFNLDATEIAMIRAQMSVRDGGRTHSLRSKFDEEQ